MMSFCPIGWGARTDWGSLGKLNKERALSLLQREPFRSWARRRSQIKNVSLPIFSTGKCRRVEKHSGDGEYTTKKKRRKKSVFLCSAPASEEVIPSPARLAYFVGCLEHRKRAPSLHSCSTSRRSLWQQGPVLAASPLSPLGPLFCSQSLPLFPSWLLHFPPPRCPFMTIYSLRISAA